MASLPPVLPMSAMHKEHHQGTQKEDQEWEYTQKMSGMLGEQKEGTHGQKSEQAQGHFA